MRPENLTTKMGLSCLVAVLWMASWSAPSSGDCLGTSLELPEGEDRIVWEAPPEAIAELVQMYKREHPEWIGVCLTISGDGPLELGIALGNVARSGSWYNDLVGQDASDELPDVFPVGLWVGLEVNRQHSGHRFRETLLDPQNETRLVRLSFHP